MGTTWQLREYTVKPGELKEWVDEWRKRIVPLRERHGFRILGAWTVDGTDQFVWIISYDGLASLPTTHLNIRADTSPRPRPAS